MDLKSFTQAIQQIEDEKGISKEKIFEAIELAIAAAYKRDYGKKGQIIRARLDPETSKVTMAQIKIVVDETMVKSEEEVKAEEEERERRLATVAFDAATVKSDATGSAKKGESEGHPKGAEEPKEIEDDKEETEGLEEKKIRFNSEKHLMIEEARLIKPDVELGDELEFPLEYREEYGRIAAQTAKQVIIQRIREIEREAVFEEYKEKEGEIVSGLVQRVEGRNVYIDIGRTVGVLTFEEQIPYERYHVGTRIKVIITLVEKNPKGPGVFLSRTHPRILRKLFEIEVPEIAAGSVEIKAIAREPGSRSKVAVMSHEEGVDPVGSLVGQKGIRVSTVINELGGEKIDVIEWSENQAEFIAHALSPAKVLGVELSDQRREARVLVPDEQLSLAIGKGGQNVRLAAKLSGWKIDVRSSKAPKTVVAFGEAIAKEEKPDGTDSDVGETDDKAQIDEKAEQKKDKKDDAL